MKLWKRILHEGLRGPDGSDDIRMGIIAAPAIVDSRPGNDRMTDLGKKGLAIPFVRFWYEYAVSDRSIAGVLCICDSKPEITPHMRIVCPELCQPDIQHIRCITVFASKEHSPSVVVDLTFGMTTDGDVIGAGDGDSMVYGVSWILPNADESALMTPVANLLDALELMSCKNVSLDSRRIDPKQARIASKRHGPKDGGYRYHVLVVRPAGSKPGSPCVEIGSMPRHVCRGHFAEYGDKYGKGLLFGKYAGRFFIPPHVKGDAKNGIIEKDYEVRA